MTEQTPPRTQAQQILQSSPHCAEQQIQPPHNIGIMMEGIYQKFPSAPHFRKLSATRYSIAGWPIHLFVQQKKGGLDKVALIQGKRNGTGKSEAEWVRDGI